MGVGSIITGFSTNLKPFLILILLLLTIRQILKNRKKRKEKDRDDALPEVYQDIVFNENNKEADKP
ncbi:hypothetical protein [Bacillus norwichensis]|uniref:DUF3951 domain-containing protein n=1 Tax=Bacillus norwichensis TaxID=2762217 RepID=A0ABR8VSA7_9BACI|nr:hypothetical protein [Bacillus norwichensis]MBD8007629.1 hypothetical protein [Bacillus norwichensis]